MVTFARMSVFPVRGYEPWEGWMVQAAGLKAIPEKCTINEIPFSG
jgi:hypothetical protein